MGYVDKTPEQTENIDYKLNKSPEEWRNLLSDMEFFVLREAGTERPGTGELLYEDRAGMYHCKACDAELFSSETKFESHCGWPSFYDPDEKGAVVYIEDRSLAPRIRTEVRCANCGSHLGHVFNDSPETPTGLRYCMNSVALRFVPGEEQN
ncbi:peptide-methionine (R)-S-oxide reductase MsrB [Arcanobacterium pinnipediorum]|uniref:peptide-methionine (R)-S-oxide reductase n=1 Tax=Arcanobacterium pinnipediorum TaxID=1503041 RepID=A0ABY5AHB0_9ACTO|nr:peptide-methionine (R)-S-oxide reductase MsrB [Arcanobacterium pinnipediorum]USR79592.1 peptide-methionine (R)-S-oxide reductase MsrB [Arcanobacterium pinnipediorum]